MIQTKFYSLLMTLLLATGSLALAQEENSSYVSQIKVRPGIQLDYFSRAVSAKDEDIENILKSYFLSLNTELQILDGFFMNAIFGYSFSNFNGMTFRKLPISLEMDVGDISGFLLGFGVQKSFLEFRNLEIDLIGQFLYSFPKQQTWSIPDLAVDGNVEGKPYWLTVQAGPLFRYTGFAYFLPYLSVGYDRLWGKFNMSEVIQDLKGSEEKDFSSLSHVNITLGFDYDISRAFSVKLQGTALPHAGFKKMDFSIMVRLMYALF